MKNQYESLGDIVRKSYPDSDVLGYLSGCFMTMAVLLTVGALAYGTWYLDNQRKIKPENVRTAEDIMRETDPKMLENHKRQMAEYDRRREENAASKAVNPWKEETDRCYNMALDYYRRYKETDYYQDKNSALGLIDICIQREPDNLEYRFQKVIMKSGF